MAWNAVFVFVFLLDYQNGVTDHDCSDLVANALYCVRATFYLKVICSAIIFLSLKHHGQLLHIHIFSVQTHTHTHTHTVTGSI